MQDSGAVVLIVSTGERLVLGEGGSLILGRANVPLTQPLATQVSRRHCEYEHLGSAGVRLHSLSVHSPTLVIEASTGQQVLLNQGAAPPSFVPTMLGTRKSVKKITYLHSNAASAVLQVQAVFLDKETSFACT